MAVNLSPVGGVAAQFFTNTGAVLTGGKIYTYSAGTTTPVAAYTSSSGATAWTNPIVLDAAGRVSGSGEIWLTAGIAYKFVLKDTNDVLIATYDNITGINSNSVSFTNSQEIITATAGQTVFNLSISYQVGTNSLSVFVDGVNQYGPGAQYAYTETDSDTVTFVSGLHVGAQVKFTTTQQQGAGAVDSSQVSYVPPFTNSVATNVEAKLAQIPSVKDFGAVGNGIVNDGSAIQAAITATAGGLLLINPGTYNVTGSTLNFTGISVLSNGNATFTGGTITGLSQTFTGAQYINGYTVLQTATGSADGGLLKFLNPLDGTTRDFIQGGPEQDFLIGPANCPYGINTRQPLNAETGNAVDRWWNKYTNFSDDPDWVEEATGLSPVEYTTSSGSKCARIITRSNDGDTKIINRPGFLVQGSGGQWVFRTAFAENRDTGNTNPGNKIIACGFTTNGADPLNASSKTIMFHRQNGDGTAFGTWQLRVCNGTTITDTPLNNYGAKTGNYGTFNIHHLEFNSASGTASAWIGNAVNYFNINNSGLPDAVATINPADFTTATIMYPFFYQEVDQSGGGTVGFQYTTIKFVGLLRFQF